MFRLILLLILAPLILPLLLAFLGALANLATPYRLAGPRWSEEDFPVAVELSRLGEVGAISPEEAQAAARSAMAGWNRALGRDLLQERDGGNRVVALSAGSGNDPAWASLESRAATMVAFTITINTDQPFSTRNDGDPSAFDLETVLAHEFGHVLGLDHPLPGIADALGDNGAIACAIPPAPSRLMCPRFAGQVMRSPGPDDVAGVRAIYGW